MKRVFAVLIMILAVFSVSCSNKAEELIIDEQLLLPESGITDAELNALIETFEFPEIDAELFVMETEAGEFPVDLINELKTAVYTDSSVSRLQTLNDESLLISRDDFIYTPSADENLRDPERNFNEAFLTQSESFLIYRLNIDNEGEEEIILFENRPYEESDSNTAYLLKKDGDNYVYAGRDTITYYRAFAVFAWQDHYYLAVNLDNPYTMTTRAVGLYELCDNTVNPMCAVSQNYVYLRTSGFGSNYHQLYQNPEGLIIPEVQRYIREIEHDLIYTDRISGQFLGDGEEPEDGKPHEDWLPDGYTRTQSWRKLFSGETIDFSLYRKDSEDIYLLDARVYKDKESAALFDYIIDLNREVELAEYWNYDDSNFVSLTYQDPDFERAFPENTLEQIEQFATRVRGNFIYTNHQHDEIPNNLIVRIEELLFYGNADRAEMNSEDYLTDPEVFYNSYGSRLPFTDDTEFTRRLSALYRYELDGVPYYMAITRCEDSDIFVNISIYQEADGGLTTLDSWTSLDSHVRLINYKDELYLFESIYHCYSKYVDAAAVYKLAAEKLRNYVLISIHPKEYETMELYNNQEPYTREINTYLKQIRAELMEKSPVNDQIRIFTGDETTDFITNKQLRLQSVGGPGTYYEIDYNNDGTPEYIEKHLWFPSQYAPLYLSTESFRFTEKNILSLSHDFYRGGTRLIQLWFKEIDGQVYTFRLFLAGNNYLLNVSRINGTDITQIQTHIIAPRYRLDVETVPIDESGTRPYINTAGP